LSVNQAFYFLVGDSTCRGNMQHTVQVSVKSVRCYSSHDNSIRNLVSQNSL